MRDEEELTPEEVLGVLDLALSWLPEKGRAEARRELLGYFARVYDEAAVPRPAWLRMGLDESVEG